VQGEAVTALCSLQAPDTALLGKGHPLGNQGYFYVAEWEEND